MKYIFRIIIAGLIFFNTIGCSSVREKFTRKKEPKKITPIVNIEDYTSNIDIKELYKKHFVFWKYWQEELVHVLGKNKKKQRRCYNETLMELKIMSSYLQNQKSSLLDKYIEKMEEFKADINKPVLSSGEVYRMKRIIKKYKRVIDKNFSLRKVESWLVENSS